MSPVFLLLPLSIMGCVQESPVHQEAGVYLHMCTGRIIPGCVCVLTGRRWVLMRTHLTLIYAHGVDIVMLTDKRTDFGMPSIYVHSCGIERSIIIGTIVRLL